ncbi:hypothetical protein [Streptomyces labedae]|uniref:RiboL-PSP-HEPN domain-containing protein n=1 Tax=Streptomyces labedae TaxID=285569 RepID=A0ABP6QZK4_9ACTN
MGRKAEFSELTSSGEKCITTLSRLSLRVGQPSVTPEWILVDSVTTVEVYVDRAINALVAQSNLTDSMFGQAVLAKLGDDMSSTWPARFDWLGEGFDVKIKGEKFAQDFDAVIECRNGIIHGSGNLTKRQRSNFVRFTELRRRLLSVLDVTTHGTKLILSDDSARRALAVSRDFAYGFDRALRYQLSTDF